MDKRHRNRKNWNNQKNNDKQNKNPVPSKSSFVQAQKLKINVEDEQLRLEKQKAIQELKERQITCPKCGQLITDIASSITDKTSGQPAHFDCVFEEVQKTETVGENEKIAYIGQGRFGVLYFENPRDQRHFTIKKIIEYESREEKAEWRSEISDLYSKIN